ncbi:MAG: Plug domain-containing protein [Holophagales bacterium]|nr:Plug domain-containing protein [Holophagales bacterium]
MTFTSAATSALLAISLALGGALAPTPAHAAPEDAPRAGTAGEPATPPPTAPATKPPADEKAAPALPRRSEEIVVQAVRADADTPVTKTEVSREEIAKQNVGQEMPALLADLPSMTYYSDTGLGNGYAYVSMRGIGPTRINFTLDGVPLNEPEDGTLYFVDFADLGSSVESLQVQRGVGTSAAGVASFAARSTSRASTWRKRPGRPHGFPRLLRGGGRPPASSRAGSAARASRPT